MMFFKARVLLWPIILVAVLIVAALITAMGLGAASALSIGSIFGSNAEDRTTLAVKSLERQQEVVVLQVGMVGIKDSTQIGTVAGIEVPGTERAVFLRYEFDAKLGFDGADVLIEPVGDTAVKVTIPEFFFIGFDNWDSELAAESNGILSWTTPEIDQLEMSNGILTEEVKEQLVEDYEELLVDQAKVFYTQIVTAIDPTIELEFVFAAAPGMAE